MYSSIPITLPFYSPYYQDHCVWITANSFLNSPVGREEAGLFNPRDSSSSAQWAGQHYTPYFHTQATTNLFTVLFILFILCRIV